MNGVVRILVGMIGGLAAGCSKVLALDVEQLGKLVETGNMEGLTDLRITIFVFTPVLMLIGAIVAWASMEENRMKLLAIGAAAPGIIAPWTAGQIDKTSVASLFEPVAIIGTAYAGEAKVQPESRYKKGLKALFGFETPQQQKYWVIVGSKDTEAEAREYAATINRTSPELNAFVGLRKPDNPYYPVIVGGPSAFLELEAAQKLLEQAKNNPLVSSDAFLSDYQHRVNGG